MHCKFDQLCSVICSGSEACVRSLLVRAHMAGSDDDTPAGCNQQPMVREALEVALRDSFAVINRNTVKCNEHRRQNACILTKLKDRRAPHCEANGCES